MKLRHSIILLVTCLVSFKVIAGTCVPLLTALQNNDSSNSGVLTEDRRVLADTLLKKYKLFDNPFLAEATKAVIGFEKLTDIGSSQSPEALIDPTWAPIIWDKFLRSLHPEATDPQQAKIYYDRWKKSRTGILRADSLGQDLTYDKFRDWQRISAELSVSPTKSQIAIELVKALFPIYIKAIGYTSKNESADDSPAWHWKNYLHGAGIGLVSGTILALTTSLDGSAATWGTGIGFLSPLIISFVQYLKQSGKAVHVLAELEKNGSALFDKALLSSAQNPMSLKEFELALDRIVDISALEKLNPSLEITNPVSITEYGRDFNSIAMAFSQLVLVLSLERSRQLGHNGTKCVLEVVYY